MSTWESEMATRVLRAYRHRRWRHRGAAIVGVIGTLFCILSVSQLWQVQTPMTSQQFVADQIVGVYGDVGLSADYTWIE
jgi:multisubunit Na+/H+ antiporter MnhB subunit